MSTAIAIVGMACEYPDSRSPTELWQNVLAQRQGFRRLPAERLCLEDYLSPDRDRPDSIYSTDAAVIEGYTFDRVRFRVSGPAFRAADLTHWLALDVASRSLADAGFPDGQGLPRETTGVLVGNSLAGEFSRANLLRVRWPYVRRVTEATLAAHDWPAADRQKLVDRLEDLYKAPFPPVGEDTLAGGLSNTIAGRICNHFDLKGGGYTVDGACAASLVATATACSSLVAGDLDVAVAGGVDLSLDPFELVGFAKVGALAADEMRVFDVRSDGFSPGEGCGFIVLMRYDDAVAEHRRIYAVVRGWGISSDGSGGITRPEVAGQLLALRRAYKRAGFPIATVPYFEGHGTGTSVGDPTELTALSTAIGDAGQQPARAAIGSIKANIGHTKAAAGIAGLIKAVMAVHTQIVPPTTACAQPRRELTGECAVLRAPAEGEAWPHDRPLRAGISAMGFGGCNAHVVVEGIAAERRQALTGAERSLLSSAQDAELVLLSGRTPGELQQQVDHLLSIAARLSRAEVGDLATHMQATLAPHPVRAAVVASGARELTRRLDALRGVLASPVVKHLDPAGGIFFATTGSAPRIGFLFPGQASPTYRTGGAWRRRFDSVRHLYEDFHVDRLGPDDRNTANSQPLIALASLAALQLIERLGISASVGLGHSLGELTALHWGGAMTEAMLLSIARARGRAMADAGHADGAMLSITASAGEVAALLRDDSVVIAAFNAPRQTVVSGLACEVNAVAERAEAKGLRSARLNVSHAFHSALVADAVPPLDRELAAQPWQPLSRTVISTVTGKALERHRDMRQLLGAQVTSPVRFLDAITRAAGEADLFIEVGPGQILSGLAAECVDVPAISLDAGGSSVRGLLTAVGASFVLGAAIEPDGLRAGRFVRPFRLPWQPRFFANPCERAPAATSAREPSKAVDASAKRPETTAHEPSKVEARAAVEIIRRLVADRAELPLSTVHDDSRLLSDLHFSSITVSQILLESAKLLKVLPPVAPTEYADATVVEIAHALQDSARIHGAGSVRDDVGLPAGVDTWVRAFTVEYVERPRAKTQPSSEASAWTVVARSDDRLGERLREELPHRANGRGVIVCLPLDPEEEDIALLLNAARAALNAESETRLVVVQHGGGGSGFCRSFHLERPDIATCVVDVPAGDEQAVDWIVGEATAGIGFSEARYDEGGRRTEPQFRLLALDAEPGALQLGPGDVLLVTGGGKGIGAECAFSIARHTGARLALIGRATPDEDATLAANITRMRAAGIHVEYESADVTDARALAAAVGAIHASLGPITGILHAAGTNEPRLLPALSEDDVVRALRPKVEGARRLLEAIDRDRLRLFIAFGSIIARTGMRGEAHYALANEWLVRETERIQRAHPACRCLAVEWSVWAGTGMGQRLGRLDALVRQGITPISIDDGVSMLRSLLAAPTTSVAVVVTGRLGRASPFAAGAERPFLRFLEQPRIDYPQIELVADATVSLATDPYLRDHVFRGDHLFPAVMGLEAMAQAASALLETGGAITFEQVTFERPIVVPERGSLTLRVAALARSAGRVDVVLRTDATSFHVDHFRAACVLASSAGALPVPSPPRADTPDDLLPLDPARDLYDGLLFQAGRFKRLLGFRRLTATECVADIATEPSCKWFSQYLPGALMLGDPGARDAAMHAVQACIPHATVLPTAIGRLTTGLSPVNGILRAWARERRRDGETLVYDLDIFAADGTLCERWEELRLRVVAERTVREWAPLLLAPYLERKVRDHIPGTTVRVALDVAPVETDRRTRSNRAVGVVAGPGAGLQHRPDGQPEFIGRPSVSVSVAHAADMTVAVTGAGTVACDAELLTAREDGEWAALVGPHRASLTRIIAHEAAEDYSTAAARVWTASECMRKAGAPVGAPLIVDTVGRDGWVVLRSGSLVTATYVAAIRGIEQRVALAVLATEQACDRMSTVT